LMMCEGISQFGDWRESVCFACAAEGGVAVIACFVIVALSGAMVDVPACKERRALRNLARDLGFWTGVCVFTLRCAAEDQMAGLR
jgi:hypothetical protein